MFEHPSESSLIELMVSERLYHREELGTSRVYELCIIDDALELSEITISGILVEAEDRIAIQVVSFT